MDRFISLFVFLTLLFFLVVAPLYSDEIEDSFVKVNKKNYDTNEIEIISKLLLNLYQNIISTQDGPSCIFQPTCSQYMKEAISTKGLLGFLAGIDRVTRCHAMNVQYSQMYERTPDGTFLDPVKSHNRSDPDKEEK